MSMKCVRTENGIIRIPTGKAQKLVNAGKASYVCKGIWKKYRQAQITIETVEAETGNRGPLSGDFLPNV